jgi:hypothetical protein
LICRWHSRINLDPVAFTTAHPQFEPPATRRRCACSRQSLCEVNLSCDTILTTTRTASARARGSVPLAAQSPAKLVESVLYVRNVVALVAITLFAAIVNGGLGYGLVHHVPLALLFLGNRVLNPALVLIEVALNALRAVVAMRSAVGSA